jgi:streptomycin 6-kinase
VSARARVPAGLGWWRARPGGAEWLERLPGIVAGCAAEWELVLGEPFEPKAHRVSPTTATVPASPSTGAISYVAPAALPDGTRAVLKVGFPESESEHEADALAHWRGEGAVRLLAADAGSRALLVERCEPGTPLCAVAAEDEANDAAAAVLRALWRPAPADHPFRPLAGEARRWRAELPARWERHGRPFERALLERAVGWIGELLDSPGEPVVLHQDLHGGNLLRAAREPWLAIDPKPLAGERAFDTGHFLRDLLPSRLDAVVSDRLVERLAAELALPPERVRAWAFVRSVSNALWSIETGLGDPGRDLGWARLLAP